MRYHYTTKRISRIKKKNQKTNCEEDVEKLGLSHIAGGNRECKDTVENNIVVHQRVKCSCHLTQKSTSKYKANRTENIYPQNYIQMVTFIYNGHII